MIKELRRLAIGISYDGSAYSGWQRQKQHSSLQEYIENALSIIADEPIKVFCASRTDSGVHAKNQVVHFDTYAIRSQQSWIFGTNSKLPKDISVRWWISVSKEFHARFSAIFRHYRYIIYNDYSRPAILHHNLAHINVQLDVEKMKCAAKDLIGKNDFTSFQSSKCQSNSSWRTIHYLKIRKCGNYIIIDIQANSFLYHMIRNIIGSLIEIGSGKQKKDWIDKLLRLKNRSFPRKIVPACGLYLMNIGYPKKFNLPNFHQNKFLFL